MESDDGLEDDGPFFAWLPPDDRLWRHPSEIGQGPASSTDADDADGESGDAVGAPEPSGGGPGTEPDPSSVATVTELDTRRPRAAATRIWTVAVVAGIIGALGASGIGMVSGAFNHQTTVVNSMSPSNPAVSLAADAGPFTWSTIDDTVSPSVVTINVQSPSGPEVGSGLVFLKANDGTTYLVSDYALGATGGRIEVTLASGDQHRGKLIGLDPKTGLAVIAIGGATPDVPLFGSVADLQVASEVLAIGARTSPGGSASVGVVSAEDREVSLAEGWSMENLIAVSSASAVQPATAGGPLVDDTGQIVGLVIGLDPVNAADQAMSFAVPIDVVKHVVGEILSNAPVTHPWLGVTDAVDLSTGDARALGLDGGAQVTSVSPGSPASHIGLRPGDVIISFDNQPVMSTGSLLTQLLAGPSKAQPTPITFLHQGKPVRQMVTVAAQPDDDS